MKVQRKSTVSEIREKKEENKIGGIKQEKKTEKKKNTWIIYPTKTTVKKHNIWINIARKLYNHKMEEK